MDRLRMAVIGVGFWGRNHVRVLSELPEVELKAVCDLNQRNLDLVLEKFNVKTYISSDEMLCSEKLDAVTICVWSTKLAQETLRALRSRIHILVEKPMAGSIGEAEQVLKAAKANERTLSVGFIERFNPGVARIKKALMEGKVGTLVSANIRRVSKWPERIGDVGVVKDTAIHDIDIARYIFDEDPSAVYARSGNMNHERFEDYAQIMLSFSNGRSAFLESNWLTPYKVRKLSITGSEAIANLDYITQELTIETSQQTLTPRFDWEEPLKLELRSFVSSVLQGKEPLVTGIDGLKALKIAEASLKSARTGRLVNLAGL